MVNVAIGTNGTTVKYRKTGTTPFLAVCGITNLSAPQGTKPTIDVTDLCSEATEHIGGLPDNGDATFSLNFSPETASHSVWFASFLQPGEELFDFLIKYGESDIGVQFTGFISQMGVTLAPNTKVESAMTVRIDGKVIYGTISGDVITPIT